MVMKESIDLPIEPLKNVTNLQKLTKSEQETKTLELAERGLIIDVVHETRRLYGFGLTKANRFIEELTE